MQKKFVVESQEQGLTLLSFLRSKWGKGTSVKAIKRAIEAKLCTVNGRVETFSTHRLKAYDKVIIEPLEKRPSSRPTVLWEDRYLLILDKPAGFVCDPKNVDGYLVHRLDKETTGVLVVAKAKPVLEQMIELFRSEQVQKTYLAIVDGRVTKKKGRIVSYLAAKHRMQGQTVYGSSATGKRAETLWIKEKEGKRATLLQCYPRTGRTHQLRVHLQEAGHPIVGDYQYGAHFQCGYRARRHLLHALEISFPHPVTRHTVTVSSPIPDDFFQAIEALHLL